MRTALAAGVGLMLAHAPLDRPAKADSHFNADSWVETKCVERGETCNFRVSPWDVPDIQDAIHPAFYDIPVSPVQHEDFYDFEAAKRFWQTFSLEELLQGQARAIRANREVRSECFFRKKTTCRSFKTIRTPEIPREDPRFNGSSEKAIDRFLSRWPGVYSSLAARHLLEFDRPLYFGKRLYRGYWDYRKDWPDKDRLVLFEDFIPADVLEREFSEQEDFELIKQGHDVYRLMVHWIYNYDRYLIYRHYYGWKYNAIPAGPACDDLYDPLFDTGCNDKPDWRNDDLRTFEAIVDAYNTMPNDLMRKLSLRWRNTKPYDGPLIDADD